MIRPRDVPHLQFLKAEPPELADAVASRTGIPGVRELILSSGWGSPLKPSAFRGDLCFGPSQGQNVTFVNPRAWIGAWQSIAPEMALQAIARLYLRSYGPATRKGIATEAERLEAFLHTKVALEYV